MKLAKMMIARLALIAMIAAPALVVPASAQQEVNPTTFQSLDDMSAKAAAPAPVKRTKTVAQKRSVKRSQKQLAIARTSSHPFGN